MKTAVLIRQRPAIGDLVLLAPLINAVREKYKPKNLIVITDAQYAAGALVDIAKRVPGVDRVENVSVLDWTTESNLKIDRWLPAPSHTPPTIKHADLVLDCNGAFMEFEREHNGNNVPYGISEFWLKHFGFNDVCDTRPKLTLHPQEINEVDAWLGDEKRPLLGIVMKAGDKARDWDFKGRALTVAHWAISNGMCPVTIDATHGPELMDGKKCVGKRLPFVAALLARCELALTPDTGLLHVAEAVGCPTVALFGIVKPELRVKGYNCIVVPRQSHGACPLDDQTCTCYWKFQRWSCLKRITLTETIDAINDARNSRRNLSTTA